MLLLQRACTTTEACHSTIRHGGLPAYMLALIYLLDTTSQSTCHTHREQALDIDNSTILFLASTGHQQASLAID